MLELVGNAAFKVACFLQSQCWACCFRPPGNHNVASVVKCMGDHNTARKEDSVKMPFTYEPIVGGWVR